MSREDNARKLITKFLTDIPPENIYKYTFEFIPLFWVVPLFFLDENLKSQFVPSLLLRHGDESYLLLDVNHYFGYPLRVLKKYLGDQALLRKIEDNYQRRMQEVDTFYNKIIEHKEDTEKAFMVLLKESLRIFQDFFSSTTPAYLDDKAVFDLSKSHSEMNEKKIEHILSIDIHKSFELIKEEALLNYADHKDDTSLAYLFTTYAKVPTKREIEKALVTVNKGLLRKSVQERYKNLQLNARRYETLYQRLTLEERRLVDFIQLLKRIREERKQYFSKIFYCFYELSGHLLKKWHLRGNGFLFLFELLQGKRYVEKININKRQSGYLVYYDKPDGPSLQSFSGDTSAELQFLKDRLSQRVGSIKGNVAYPGVVEGKVVVAIQNKDFLKIKEHDVLVTSMTRPEIVPYLKKVGAIITDEGGVTCHAAILSRELQIPCITGTQRATQVLKDGDLVEVDAENGVVTKKEC